jgi:ubiquinone/menaquinone biosynthesis C-methylase UbiE
MLKTQSAQQYWDQRTEHFSRFYTQPDWFDRVFRKAIFVRIGVAAAVGKSLEAPTALDIGSGPGINSVTLIKEGGVSHLTGIDFSSQMISSARTTAEEAGVSSQCDFIEGDFLCYDWGDQQFDLIVALGVLDYVSVPGKFLERISNITRTAFVISWPKTGLRMLLRKLRYKCHVYGYSEAAIIRYHQAMGITDLNLVRCQGGWVTIARKV